MWANVNKPDRGAECVCLTCVSRQRIANCAALSHGAKCSLTDGAIDLDLLTTMLFVLSHYALLLEETRLKINAQTVSVAVSSLCSTFHAALLRVPCTVRHHAIPEM